jgi:hypothetical protein
MMAGVNATTAVGGGRLWSRAAAGVLVLLIVAAGAVAVWYRGVYNVWPGQGASARVHWCGRDYESFGGPPRSWGQISVQEPAAIHAVGAYPPLGWSRQELFAAATAGSLRPAVSGPQVCATIVYLRTGPGQYRPYSLEGGP